MSEQEQAATILVVDDERQIRRLLKTGLGLAGFAVAEAENAAEGLRQAMAVMPDLVLLDLGLPDRDGLDLLRQIRDWSAMPIIVLSVRAREAEKVAALEAGADDYVTKPFGMAELVARIRAGLRRRQGGAAAPDPVFAVGTLVVDVARRRVSVGGTEVKLSPKEYRLLHHLVRHAGKVVTHDQLLREVWGPAHVEDVHYLRIFMRKLRNRIEPDPTRPRYLLTELGIGYRLRTPDQLET